MKRLTQNTHNIFKYYPLNVASKVFYTWLRILVKNRFRGTVSSGYENIVGFTFEYGNRGSFYGMFKEIFLEQNYLIAPTNEKLRIIDCGSNIGMSVAYFKFLAPNSVVTSFEPNPHTFEVLKRNLERNTFSVELYNAGVAGEAGEMTIYTDSEDVSSQSASATKHLTNKERPLEALQVKMLTLSSFINEQIDVVKLDIEGAEGEVLDELAANGKLSLIKKLFIEYHFDGENTMYPLGRMLTRLDEAGFKYVIETGITFPYVIGRSKKNYSSKLIAWK